MELMTIAIGTFLIGLFVYSNLRLDGAWSSMTPGKTKPTAPSVERSIGRGREMRGIVEATLLFVGTALIAAAFTKIAVNSGYGGF